MDIENLKKIIEKDKDAKFIIIENGKPSFVLMSFESYYKLMTKYSQSEVNESEELIKLADDNKKVGFKESDFNELELLRSNNTQTNKDIVDIENLTI